MKSLVITHWTARSYIWLLVKWWILYLIPREVIELILTTDWWMRDRRKQLQKLSIVERREEWSGCRDEGMCLLLLFVCRVRDSCLSCYCLFAEWVSESVQMQVHLLVVYFTNIQICKHVPQTHAIVDSNKLQNKKFKIRYLLGCSLIGRLSPERSGFKSPQWNLFIYKRFFAVPKQFYSRANVSYL